jgi:cyclopropane-fatty-acyl-phospholipid synthase
LAAAGAAFALYLHKHYGCEVLGVALAPDQIAFCKERAQAEGVDDKVKFALMDYRDVEGQFDRISSVGLLEHVGTPHYPEFYEHTYKLLKPDGVMFSHCCGRSGPSGLHRCLDPQVHFPGRLYPGAVRAGHREREGRLGSDGSRSHALPLQPHPRGVV